MNPSNEIRNTFEIKNGFKIYNFPKCIIALENLGRFHFGSQFKVHEIDIPVIKKLITFAIRDEQAAAEMNLNIHKGLILSGPVGCGKTSLMFLINYFFHAGHEYKIKPCRDIAFEFASRGYEALKPYTKIGDKQTRINTFCFDDLGTEKQIKHFGNDCNVMAEILLIIKTFELKIIRISKRIGFVLAANCPSENKKGKITITANGYRKLFYLVNAIVNLAPITPLFEIEAFIKPVEDLEPFKNGTDEPFNFADFEIKTSDLFFLPIDYNTNRKRIKIKIFTDKYRFHYDNEALEIAIQIIVQNLIGEINLRKTLAEIQLAQLPDNPQNLIPLYELQEYIVFLQKINHRVKIEI
jgi:hypothetical protein